MKRTPQAIALLIAWLAILAVLGWFVQRQLVVGADLRLFLPSPTTPEQRLLLEEIGEGPASRVLVIALDGAPPEQLADVSRAFAESLRDSPHFRFVSNGELSLDAIPDELLPYRFLLSPTLDTQTFDADFLRKEIQARVRDLSSPAGTFLEPWLPRDPTLELLKTLQRWQPMQEPRREFDVWFDGAGRRALLIAETRAPAFDPDRQRLAIAQLNAALADASGNTGVTMTVTGAGKFSVMMEARTRGEAQALGTAATVGMILLLLIAYRRIGSLVLSALPLASAGLVGLAAVSAFFGTVHGITLAFGFTLIGVAQDYPLHLLSHRRANHEPVIIARQLWPTLATGVASTCIAYFTFLFSGVIGLAQLACFTVTALAVAGLTTRFALPALMDRVGRDFGDSRFLDRLCDRIAALPRMRWIAVALGVLAVAVVSLAPQPFWENDLAKLTPVPEDLLIADQQLRSQVGTPDMRYLLVVAAADREQVLRRLEALEPELQALVEGGAITGYDHAARYVPSKSTQLSRQQRLPESNALRAALRTALAGTAFRSDVFEPFIRDVEQARTLPPLTPEKLRASPLGAALDMLMTQRQGNSNALVTFSGVKDVAALQALATAAGNDVKLLDVKDASESLIAAQRTRILWTLSVAVLLLIAVIAFALRSKSRVYRVLAPMALTTVLVLAVLRATGVSLNLFHLIALILAAGLGLDYALFFEHAAQDRAEQRRTLHAVLVCSLSTLMVFALLAISDVPVLHAIGFTVSLGVVFNFALALLLTRPDGAAERCRDGKPGKASGRNSATATGPFPGFPSRHRAPGTEISSLIPHQGAMCLLDRLLEWNDERIALETATHRSPDNPLRTAGRLRAIHLCEYGAQAMAVHGALKSQAHGGRATAGMLVSLRSVTFARDFVEDLPGTLRVEAVCLQASASSLQYSFRVLHAEGLLAEGRAAVMLQKESE
jgi:predicted exporter/predicted hotdog family 3-hydroxylacyl-ACP dehydratase